MLEANHKKLEMDHIDVPFRKRCGITLAILNRVFFK
jgi:hypothetical protein